MTTTVTVFGIANCDQIRKTRKWLDTHGIDYDFHDYRKQGCDPELVRTLLLHFDLDTLINRRGTTWRNLPEQDRESLTVTTAPEILSAQPTLIKRPLLRLKNNEWLLGAKDALARMQDVLI